MTARGAEEAQVAPRRLRWLRWLRRPLAWVRRAWELVPLTGLGLCVSAVAFAAVVWFGHRQLDLVLLVFGFAAVGMVALATLVVVVAALWVRLRGLRHAETDDLVMDALHPTTTGVSLPSLRFVPLLRLTWEWWVPGEPARGFAAVAAEPEGGRLHEHLVVAERCAPARVVRRVTIEDVLGLARVTLRLAETRNYRVLPATLGLRQVPVLAALSGGDEQPHPMGLDDGDRVELRRYVPGDPARFIHWKVFGRTRKLVVRVPERALSRARRMLVYMVAGAGDEASAALARVAVEERALGDDWSLCADGTHGDATDVPTALRAIVGSRAQRHDGGHGLAAFLRRSESRGPASLLIFAPAEEGPWVARVLEVVRARPGRARIVIGVTGIAAPGRPAWWRRLLIAAPRRDGSDPAALERVLGRLARERCDVVVIDRVTGKLVVLGRGSATRRVLAAQVAA